MATLESNLDDEKIQGAREDGSMLSVLLEAAVNQMLQAEMTEHLGAAPDERTLSLPVMVAFVLSLIWRQVGSVSEAVRVLEREGFLWCSPLQVSQQALSERLRTLPAVLFEGIPHEILPQLQARAETRACPLEPAAGRALRHFTGVVALDGSTLDVLMRKVGLLRLVEVSYRGHWHRYLTNVLDPEVLSARDVAALYRGRWRIEDAFHTKLRSP